MTKNKHLKYEERDLIHTLLNKNKTFTYIGKTINKDRTTVAKEIKTNRYIQSYHFHKFDLKGINKAIEDCDKLCKPPYVCNKCHNKPYCKKHKLYYNPIQAQKRYEFNLKDTREGLQLDYELIDRIERYIIPLIKEKKQTINQVYANHNDTILLSKSTFYHYIKLGVFSITVMDLPYQIRYKKRVPKNKYKIKRNLKILNGRKYDDYLNFKEKHPKFNEVQMDTVEGPKGKSKKVLLTIIFVDTKFMIIKLLDNKRSEDVSNVFLTIKKQLGNKLFKEIFRIILTDNGSEFFNPYAIENNIDNGQKLVNLFYCNPNSSWQKGAIEHSHKNIRKVFPKGYNFDNLSHYHIKNLQSNINNIPRESLNGETPYNKTLKKYPDVINKLNATFIKPDNVSLNISDILKEEY